MPNKKVQLIIEKSGNDYWGRVKINDNLIVESAPSEESLKKSLQKLILDIEGIDIDEFQISYESAV
jgi:hypothetical protein